MFSDRIITERALLPKAVATKLRAELPGLLRGTNRPSSAILRGLMRSWYEYNAPLLLQMLHEIAYTASRNWESFYSPSITSRAGKDLVVRYTLLPFDQLVIEEGNWQEFIRSLLTEEDGRWFRELLETHDRLVGART